jgi:phage-related protein
MAWWDDIGNAIAAAAEAVGNAIEDAVNAVADAMADVVETVGNAIEDGLNAIGSALSGIPLIGGFLSGFFSWLAGYFQSSEPWHRWYNGSSFARTMKEG